MFKQSRFAAVLGCVLIAIAVLMATGPASATSSLSQKNLRLEVNLYDVEDGIFDATLNDIHPSVPKKIRHLLWEQIGETSFELDARRARCYAVQDGASRNAKCSELADLVEDSPVGIDASLLGRAIAGEAISFQAKKLTVYLPDTDPVQPPPDPLPAPPGFYKKNVRLDVTLHDAEGMVFDATFGDAPLSRPAVRDYLWQELDGATFEIDGGNARCFLVQNDEAAGVDCAEIAAIVDDNAYGGVYASVLARPVEGDELSFRGKKITVWI